MKTLLEVVKRYKNDPVGWIEKYIDFSGLEYEGLTPQQIEICEALVKHKRLCIAAGGGIGKSALVAMLIQWFLITHPGSRIPTTAPTARQLHDVLFSEIEKWLRRNQLRGFYRLLRGKLHIVDHTDWYAVARTVPKDNRAINGTLAGFHSKHMLIAVDEAADVPDGVFTALDGAMTNDDCYIILISNPVSSGGYFYDTITDPEGKGAGFKVMYFNSIDSPLVSQSYIDNIIARYGKDSPMYKAKVLGQPLSMYDNVVVAPKTFDDVVRSQKDRCEGKVVLGVDVAGSGGDLSVICHRVGNSIVRWDSFETNDSVFLAKEIERLVESVYHKKDVTVVIDAIGLGDGVVGLLKRVNVLPFKGSRKADKPDMYKNRRTEVYHNLSRKFKDLHWPVDPPERLKKELANLLFDCHSGPMNMEPKKKFYSRLGFSPDFADALALTFAVDVYSKMVSGKLPKPVINHLQVLRRQGDFGNYAKFI